jgi:acyl carrier protein
MEDRIFRVVSDVLGVPIEKVNDDSSPDTIQAWDSLSHINLILALEAEFAISLSPDDVLEMLSVGLIRTILAEKAAAG